MFRWSCTVTLLAGSLAVSLSAVRADTLTADVAALKAAGIETTGEGLVKFFKKRTLSEAVRTKIEALVRDLGADEYAVREKATSDLIDQGDLSRGAVALALKDPDPEIRRRALRVLQKIGAASSELHLFPAAARVLADQKPAGGLETLFAFLPNVEDVAVAEEVGKALPPLVKDKDGKVDPLLLANLTDRFAVKRFAAAEALIKAGGDAHRPAVKKLLKDADVGVRRRVALALLEARDKEAIPALIALLGVSSSEDAGMAEDALRTVAGDKAPGDEEGDTEASRERYRKAWAGWWKDNESKTDLTKIDLNAAGQGVVLVGVLGTAVIGKGAVTSNGAILALDNAGRTKWKISGVYYPSHASMSRRDRVLICESYGNKITERDTKGAVLWTKNVPNQALSVERLSNGNTFVVTRNQLVEWDKDGREVRSISRPGYDVIAGCRQKDGKYLVLTQNGICLKLDSGGKQVGSFSTGGGFVSVTTGFRPAFLPTGGIVIPNYGTGKVREYDASGKLVWEFDTYQPNSVARLPNGNTLICSRLRNQITEVDRKGKEVSKKTVEGRPIFIDRR